MIREIVVVAGMTKMDESDNEPRRIIFGSVRSTTTTLLRHFTHDLTCVSVRWADEQARLSMQMSYSRELGMMEYVRRLDECLTKAALSLPARIDISN